jgi:hypothetical protein
VNLDGAQYQYVNNLFKVTPIHTLVFPMFHSVSSTFFKRPALLREESHIRSNKVPKPREQRKQKIEAKRATKPKKKRATAASKAVRREGEQSGGSPRAPKSRPHQVLTA